ncbi:hypothetical protein BC834DRAFT_1041364 [Gloeopeniophorella convolvens]|nr:hypothetical protein BC834DRAFT_1041364 [Gloeopeniophorella convolvens]
MAFHPPQIGLTTCNSPQIISSRLPANLLGWNEPLESRLPELPDDVLLVVFQFYLADFCPTGDLGRYSLCHWHPLSRVSQRWRQILLHSPRALQLSIDWNARWSRPTLEQLSHFHSVPLFLFLDHRDTIEVPKAAIEHFRSVFKQTHRAYSVKLWGPPAVLHQLFSMMDKPAPELESLDIRASTPSPWAERPSPCQIAYPDNFLGGVVPQLRRVSLEQVPVSKPLSLLLALSGPTHFSPLHSLLIDLPASDHVTPDVFLGYLSLLPRLEKLRLTFHRCPESAPMDEHSTPLATAEPHTLIPLPGLKYVRFRCTSAWMEAVAGPIHAPILRKLHLSLTDARTVPEMPNLAKLIVSEFCAIGSLVALRDEFACIQLDHPRTSEDPHRHVDIKIDSTEYDVQLASVANLFTSLAPVLQSTKRLDLFAYDPLQVHQTPDFSWGVSRQWRVEVEPGLWRRVLAPLEHLTMLGVDKPLGRAIGRALDTWGEGQPEAVLSRLGDILVHERRGYGEGWVERLTRFSEERNRRIAEQVAQSGADATSAEV